MDGSEASPFVEEAAGWLPCPPSPLRRPKGSGKISFINRFLRQRAEAFRFANPDAASLSRWERA